jgi:DNA-binding transcriptional LysR family regulator
MRTNNGDTCRAAALQDQGIVLQPDFLIGDDIKAGRLVELMPQWHAGELGIFAVYPSRRYLSAKVRLLVEYLVEQLKR